MPVGYIFEDFFTKPLTKLHNTFLMARWTKISSFARKGEQKFVTTFFTFDPCKAIVQDAAVQIAVDDLFDVRPEETVFLCELVVIDLLQMFKIVFDTLIVLGFLGFSGMVDRGYIGHLPLSSRKITQKQML